jgi:hypothetical protein
VAQSQLNSVSAMVRNRFLGRLPRFSGGSLQVMRALKDNGAFTTARPLIFAQDANFTRFP